MEYITMNQIRSNLFHITLYMFLPIYVFKYMQTLWFSVKAR